MQITDRTHDRPTGWGDTTWPQRDLTHGEMVRVTVEARRTALDAATRLIASGGKWQHRVPLELAGSFEAWILREDPAE